MPESAGVIRFDSARDAAGERLQADHIHSMFTAAIVPSLSHTLQQEGGEGGSSGDEEYIINKQTHTQYFLVRKQTIEY